MLSYATPERSERLSTVLVRSLLGSGSNGVVLAVTFPTPVAPRQSQVALKVMSHFWDKAAIALLDCERATLAALPRHPNIIVLFEEFPATIPLSLFDYLTPDMQNAVLADPTHQTQVFCMELHPSTIEAYRQMFPMPLPWHILWRLARDLVAAVVHMHKHKILHLDLKADNVLIAHDGRVVLADFGISHNFNSLNGDAGFSIQYSEPFPILMNRLVLAPEVLVAYDSAKASWRAQKSSEASVISFSQQGIWSVGVLLYELACLFGHEPSYPDTGGGVRNIVYSLSCLPPLPCCESVVQTVQPASISHSSKGVISDGTPSIDVSESRTPAVMSHSSSRTHYRAVRSKQHVERGFSRMQCGGIRYTVPQGYPNDFCALVLSMLDSDPSTRISASDALLALDAMSLVYTTPAEDATCTDASLPVFVLPDGCVVDATLPPWPTTELPTERGVSDSASQGSSCRRQCFPVLLRHCTGACRFLSCASLDTIEATIVRWDSAAEVACFSGSSEPRALIASTYEALGLADARILLGGAVMSRDSTLGMLVDLVDSLAVPPLRDSRLYGGRAQIPVLVLDLVPPEPLCINSSADYVLLELKDAYSFVQESDRRRGLVSSACALFLSPLSALEVSEHKAIADRQAEVLAWLRTFGATAIGISDAGSVSKSARGEGLPRTASQSFISSALSALPDVDMYQALLYRCCLALTGLSNLSLRDDSSNFPFVSCALRAVETIRFCAESHEALAAAVGLLRNVSCTEDRDKAAQMVAAGAVEAALDAALSPWPLHDPCAAVIPSGRSSINSSTFDLCVPFPVGDSPRAPVAAGDKPPHVRPHAADARLAEDAILSISNLLRFDEQQHAGVPAARCARLAATVIPLFRRNIGIHESAVKMLRYVSAVGEDVAEPLATSGALQALCTSLEAYPGNLALVSDALHVICSLLVYDCCRRAEVCPYEQLAAAVVSTMNRSEFLDSVTIQALGATVLRNLACVVVDGGGAAAGTHGSFVGGSVTASAALAVANAGAPAVLEAAMERMPNANSVQENGRCALYNLLLIGAGDARAALRRVAELEVEMASLRLANMPTTRQDKESPTIGVAALATTTKPPSRSRGGSSFSPTAASAASSGGPRTPRTPIASALPPSLVRVGRASSSSFAGARALSDPTTPAVGDDSGTLLEKAHSLGSHSARQRSSISSVTSTKSTKGFLAPILEASDEAVAAATRGEACIISAAVDLASPAAISVRSGALPDAVPLAGIGSKRNVLLVPRLPLAILSSGTTTEAALSQSTAHGRPDDAREMHAVVVELDSDVGTRMASSTGSAQQPEKSTTSVLPPALEQSIVPVPVNTSHSGPASLYNSCVAAIRLRALVLVAVLCALLLIMIAVSVLGFELSGRGRG